MEDGTNILKLPRWLFVIRVNQAVLALTIFALACYGVSVSSFDGDSLILFTGLATLILIAYILVSEHFFPLAYNFWAILGLECFAVLFWLVSFALLASEVSGTGYVWFSNCYLACFDNTPPYKRSLNGNTFHNAMAAAAGLGGVEFALFVVSLVVVGIFVHRERTKGAEPAATETTQTVTQTATQWPANRRDLEPGRVEMQNQTPSGFQQAQYPAQAAPPSDPRIQHVHEGGGYDDGGTRLHYNIEV